MESTGRAEKIGSNERGRLYQAPNGLDYLPFQKDGIDFLTTHSNVLLADQMGLGKTVQVIGLINRLPELKRILIICPASLRLNWERELKKWLVRPYRIQVLNGGKTFDHNADIVVVNFDILSRHRIFLIEKSWDLLVIDEAHYLKNPTTLRCTAVFGNGGVLKPIPAVRRVFVTGTPIENRPKEIWTLVSQLSPTDFGNWTEFALQYCEGRKTNRGLMANGASNLEELQARLRTTVMIRRLKKEVLHDLPEKRRQLIELPPNGCTDIVQHEYRIWERYLSAKAELCPETDEDSYEEAVERLRYEVRLAFAELARARHEVAKAKVPYVMEHLNNFGHEKVVVFAHHRAVINKLKEGLGDRAVAFHGAMGISSRQKAIDDFQKKPEVQFFIGSIMAAGCGITLTAASNVVFAELDWTPGKVAQAEDRVHRIGQRNAVLVQYLVFDNSVDAKMAKTLLEKQAIISEALDTMGGVS